MWRIYLILLFILQGFIGQAQKNIAGFYSYDNYVVTEALDLQSDSTFSLLIDDGRAALYQGSWTFKKGLIILSIYEDSLSTMSHKGKGPKRSRAKGMCIRYINDRLLSTCNPGNMEPKGTRNLSDSTREFIRIAASIPYFYSKRWEYDENGAIRLEYIYDDQGIRMSLASYPNGFKKRIVEFKRHYKHGSDLQFSKKGKLLILGEWRKGKPSGVWIFYDNRGNILKEVKGRKLRKTKDPSLKKLIEF